MEEEFYAAIKLVSGEEIFTLVCATEENEKTFLLLQNPVIMTHMVSRQGLHALKIAPWMSIPNDELYIICIDKVITMTEIKDCDIIKTYNKYIKNTSRVAINDINGFISKVDDARRTLENLYNS